MEGQEPRKKIRIKAILLFGVVAVIVILFGLVLFNNYSSEPEKKPTDLVNQPAYCKRTTPFNNEPRFQRAISLAKERVKSMGEQFRKIENCLKIEYANSASELSGAEGIFQLDQDGSTYLIKVSPNYQEDSDTVTALLLVHEIMHAVAQDVRLRNNVSFPPAGTSYQEACVTDEVIAFTMQVFFVTQLNNNERKPLIVRSFLDEIRPEDTRTIESVKQIIEWGLQADPRDLNTVVPIIEKSLRDNPYYQKQCELN